MSDDLLTTKSSINLSLTVTKTVFHPVYITTMQQYILSFFLTFFYYSFTLHSYVRTELFLYKMTQTVTSSGKFHHVIYIKSRGSMTWSYTCNCFLNRCVWKIRQNSAGSQAACRELQHKPDTLAGKGLKNTFSSLTPAVSSFLKIFNYSIFTITSCSWL